jgi:hypothetical protein
MHYYGGEKVDELTTPFTSNFYVMEGFDDGQSIPSIPFEFSIRCERADGGEVLRAEGAVHGLPGHRPSWATRWATDEAVEVWIDGLSVTGSVRN